MMRWSARLTRSISGCVWQGENLPWHHRARDLATRRHTWERDEIIVLHVNVGIPRKFLVPVRRLAKNMEPLVDFHSAYSSQN